MTMRMLSAIGSVAAVALTAHTLWNARALRKVTPTADQIHERVSILLPVRDEVTQVDECLAALRRQEGLPDVEILVLDDGSSDGTADLVQQHVQQDRRVRLLTGDPLPPGWLGKPHACHQLASHATGDILCFIDADVQLHPRAVASSVALTRRAALDLVSPYPRQIAEGVGPRLVQPLLQWSWLTTLPLRIAERPGPPSLAAANGQLLLVDRAAYEAAGGHAAVRDEVIEDVGLLRRIKRTGGCGGVVDGSQVATCRMYADWPELRAGYEKSLWSAFGTPVGAVAALAALNLVYVLPAVAAARGDRIGIVGYAGGVLGRLVVARHTDQRVVPEVFSQPLSILTLTWLTWRSWQGHAAGTLSWKGRPVGERPTGEVRRPGTADRPE